MSLVAQCWSPVAGDQRLAFEHEREGDERPGIWDLSTGERTDLALELAGGVVVQDWWPDGSALLLQNTFEGRSRLYRYELARGELDAVSSEPGFVWKARVRPDGTRVVSPRAGSPATARPRRLGSRAACLGERTRPGRRAVPVLALRESTRPAGARLLRDARRLGWAVPGDDVRPRRPDLARPRSLAAGGAGLRRRGIRGRDGQLPRFDRIRPRVARHVDRGHRRAGARGRERGSRRIW